jgi:hypothetical protein
VARLALRDALTRLPPGQRAAVVLRFYEDLVRHEAPHDRAGVRDRRLPAVAAVG